MTDVPEESETVERKESISDWSGIAHTLCAFANGKGGSLYIGVDNKGIITGLKGNTNTIQEKIADLFREFKPIPFHTIRIEEHGYKLILIITVKPLEKEMCFYHGRAWVRSGNTTRSLEGSPLIQSIREKNILSFEDGISSATFDDIDTNLIAEYFKYHQTEMPALPVKELLHTIKVAENNHIKNLGTLFFAKEIKQFIPQSSIKLVKFQGISPVTILNADFFTGPILSLLERTFTFIKTNSATRYEIKDVTRMEIKEFPLVAYREAVINAVGHRDYFDQNSIQLSIFDDRLEITNPGKLPDGITVHDLGSVSKHRNPRLYNMLSFARLVEGVGTGVPRMILEMRKNGLADPVFLEIAGMFRVTLYNTRGTHFLSLNENEKKSFGILKRKGAATASEIAKEVGVSVTSVLGYLVKLEKLGYVRKTGATRGSKFICLE